MENSHTDNANIATVQRVNVGDAVLLLEFAVTKGMVIGDNIIDIISKSKYYKDDDWDYAKDAEFQKSYNELCKLTSPVTIDSIKALNEILESGHFFKKLRTISEITIGRYERLTYAGIAILLVFQSVWSFGNSVIIDFNDINNKLELAVKEKESKSRIDPESVEVSKLETNIMSYNDRIEADLIMLDKLSVIVPDYFLKIESKESLKFVSAKLILQQSLTFELYIIQIYFLPLLYGFVGACAYILRSISNEIAAVTFSPNSNVRYRLRWQLGALSGLAIGWLASTPSGGGSNISQFALAFVAGYSVDLLFVLMDKIIATFTTSK